MSNGEQYVERFLDNETRRFEEFRENLQSAGWNVEVPPLEPRAEVEIPNLELTRQLNKDLDEFRNLVLNHRPQLNEWPYGWLIAYANDPNDELSLPDYDRPMVWIGYYGEYDEGFFEFGRRLADVYSTKKSWYDRWLGKLGMSAGP